MFLNHDSYQWSTRGSFRLWKILDTPCTAGARSAIDWSERIKNGEYIGRRCTENWLQRIPKLHFYFDRDATNVNSVVFKKSKKVAINWSKKGSLNVSVSTANVLVGGSTFWNLEIDVKNYRIHQGCVHPPNAVRKNHQKVITFMNNPTI